MNLNYVKAQQLQAGRLRTSPRTATISKETIREFNNVVNTQKRNEMPNKYNTQTARPQDLEEVISTLVTDKYGTEPKTNALTLLREHLANGSKVISDPRPFYYANRNDMMSLDEFFKAYKISEYQREMLEKQQLRERIETSRQKIDELRKSSPIKSPQRSNMISPNLSPQKSLNNTLSERFFRAKPLRPSSSNPYMKPEYSQQDGSASQLQDAEGVKLSNHFSKGLTSKARPQTANLFSKPNHMVEGIHEDVYEETPEVLEEYEESPNVKNNKASTFSPREFTMAFDTQNPQHSRIYAAKADSALSILLDQPQKPKTEAFITKNIVTSPIPTQRKVVLNTQPKFTAKEIYRHLAYLTVTPRKMKKSSHSGLIEQYYVGIFRDKKALDKSLELSRRKQEELESVRTLPNLLSESMPHHLQSTAASRNCRRLITDATSLTSSDYVKEMPLSPGGESVFRSQMSNRYEDEMATRRVRQNIDTNIRHIDKMLKEGELLRRPDSGISRSQLSSPKPKVEKFSQNLTNRVPLRKEIEKKYNMKVILNRNKNLTERMKQMRSSLEEKAQISHNQVAYDNAKYIHYYHL